MIKLHYLEDLDKELKEHDLNNPRIDLSALVDKYADLEKGRTGGIMTGLWALGGCLAGAIAGGIMHGNAPAYISAVAGGTVGVLLGTIAGGTLSSCLDEKVYREEYGRYVTLKKEKARTPSYKS
jgi:hypothetical protein